MGSPALLGYQLAGMAGVASLSGTLRGADTPGIHVLELVSSVEVGKSSEACGGGACSYVGRDVRQQEAASR